MLEIINELESFFEDCYRKISVREYAKLMKISPPTASTQLNWHEKEGLLIKSSDRNYLFFRANIQSNDFIDLSRIYWRKELRDLINHADKKMITSTIILFGSLSKAEVKIDSDVDIAIFGTKKEIDFSAFEKKLKRKIEIFWFKSINEIRNKELANSIINGYVLQGRLNF